MINTLIIDDTVTYRKLLSEVVSQLDDLDLVGTAPSGKVALQKIPNQKVDLIICDVVMPEMDGLETLKGIQKISPETSVVMISEVATKSTDITVEALGIGAIDFIKKPGEKNFEESVKALKAELKPILNIIRTKMYVKGTQDIAARIVKKGPIKNYIIPKHFSICCIGASTGGPEALRHLIPLLPKDFPIPIVLVVHMPEHFSLSLAKSLNKHSQLEVIEAKDCEQLEKGKVYLAPGGKHMTVTEQNQTFYITLNDEPPEESCKPSVNVLFRSIATMKKMAGAISIILTGMGEDGLKGVFALKEKGCYSITQSSASSLIYGMPRAVEEAGLSDAALSLQEIKEKLIELTM